MERCRSEPVPGLASFSGTPLARVLGTLVGRWSVLTLDALDDGHNHFNELQRSLKGISHKVLVDTLRALQRDGIAEGPLTRDGSTGYWLTPLGDELVDLVAQIREWAQQRQPELSRAREDFDGKQTSLRRAPTIA